MAKRKPRFKIETITSIYEKRVPDRVKELAAKHINQESLRLISNIQSDMRKKIQKILRKGEREGQRPDARLCGKSRSDTRQLLVHVRLVQLDLQALRPF